MRTPPTLLSSATRLVLLAALALSTGCSDATSTAPRLGNLTYTADEVFTPVSVIESPGGHGNVTMIGGYLLVIYSSDGGGTALDGGIEFWDVSRPRAPRLVRRHDNADTHELREPHGFGLANTSAGRFLATQGIEGVQFWDVGHVPEIRLVSFLDLPGIHQGNYAGDWWVFWQAPWLFVAGRASGIYVVDASDPATPLLARHLPTGKLGGMSPSILYAVGNLLVVTGSENGHFLTLDISDPTNPLPIQFMNGRKGYSHLFAAGTLMTSGGSGDTPKLYLHPIDHDGTISVGGEVGSGLGDGGYGSYQDGFFHGGFSSLYSKFDVHALIQEGTASSGIPASDHDFAVALGNLIFSGNDHGNGSALIVHQEAPDTTGPAVTWVHPADGATGLALTSRVGVSMSDHVDFVSVSAQTFRVRPQGGDVLAGRFSTQMGLVNFCPDAPFEADTVYEVAVENVRDVAGNRGPLFESQFTTGPAPSGSNSAPTFDIASFGPVETGETVDLEVIYSPGGGPATSYSWNFGDGSPPTPPSALPSATHVYADPGRYTVLLTASNEHGDSSSAAVQVVHLPLPATPPRSASEIVLTSDHVVCVNPDNDSVSAVRKSDHDLAWESPVNRSPRGLAVAPDGRLWIACAGGDALDVLEASSGSLFASHAMPRGSRPHSVLFTQSNNNALVLLEGTGQLVEVDPNGNIVRASNTGPTPRGLASSSDGERLLVTQFISNDDVGRVREFRRSDFGLARTFELAVDPGPDSEAAGRGLPNALGAVVISPDETLALIPSKKDNIQRGLFRDGLALDFQSSVRAIVSRLDLSTNSEVLASRLDLNDRSLPQSLCFSPSGDLVFVASQGSDRLEVYDTWNSELLTSIPTGAAPRGLALDANAGRLYVHDYLDRSVTTLDVEELLEGTENEITVLATTNLVTSEASSAQVLTGKKIFYNAADSRMSRDGYLSCAACHLDSTHDGRTWDFTQAGEGLRNTISLSGRAGLGHGRLHWTANFDEVQDFENDVRALGSGTGFMDETDFSATEDPLGLPKAGLAADLDALAAYVASLTEFAPSPHREQNGAHTAEALLGQAVFQARHCDDCHAGPDFRDGLRHDVGTIASGSGQGIGAPLAGAGFDTPTLRGLWRTAPYLHDGSASTLRDVLNRAGHGESALLTETEKDQLEAYLLELE